MTRPICPYCHQPADEYFRTTDRNRRVSTVVFVYYRCAACGLIFLSPIPPDLGRYYRADYYHVPGTLDELVRAAASERYKVDILRQFAKQGRLLEIGPSYGAFAYLAKQAGFAVEAIERDAECCRFLEQVVGVRATQSDDVTAAIQHIQPEPFDIIALWHVIEHLTDPWRTLEAVAGSIKDGGLLVLATPNPQALQFHMLRRFWAHIDAPRHIELIPASLLARRMQDLGFQQVFLTTSDEGTVRNNKFGWHGSLMAMASSPIPRGLLRGIGRVIGRVVDPFERQGMRGSGYTVVFRKTSGHTHTNKSP